MDRSITQVGIASRQNTLFDLFRTATMRRKHGGSDSFFSEFCLTHVHCFGDSISI